jgi:hypothetical protein
MYNIYYPEDPAKEPVGIVYCVEKFHYFYHSATTGNPYIKEKY